jgi:hypothetical protein
MTKTATAKITDLNKLLDYIDEKVGIIAKAAKVDKAKIEDAFSLGDGPEVDYLAVITYGVMSQYETEDIKKMYLWAITGEVGEYAVGTLDDLGVSDPGLIQPYLCNIPMLIARDYVMRTTALELMESKEPLTDDELSVEADSVVDTDSLTIYGNVLVEDFIK